MDWIDLAQDRDRWRVFVKAIMTFGFLKIREISGLVDNRLDSQEELSSME